jgi:hypothetical protein
MFYLCLAIDQTALIHLDILYVFQENLLKTFALIDTKVS